MNPNDYLTKLTQCAQQGKVLDLATGECVEGFPPPGYTPPTPGGGGGTPGTELPTGHVLIAKAELDKLERKQADLESSVSTWRIVAIGAGAAALVAGTVAIFR